MASAGPNEPGPDRSAHQDATDLSARGGKLDWWPLALLGGYLLLAAGMVLAYTGPDAEYAGPPTCDGEVMEAGDTCLVFIRTGTNLSADTLTAPEIRAQGEQAAKETPWTFGAFLGTVGTILVFVGAGRSIAVWRRSSARTAAASAIGVATVPLLAAVAVVGWLELRYEPGDRSHFFLPAEWLESPFAMTGLVLVGTVSVLAVVVDNYWAPPPLPPAPPVPEPVVDRGPDLAGYEVARWGRRAAARVIDVLVVGIVLALGLVPLSLAFERFSFLLEPPEDGSTSVLVPAMFIYALVTVLLETLLLNRRGASVGKLALRLRVVGWERGARGGWGVAAGVAAVRAATWWLPISFWRSQAFGSLLFLFAFVNGLLPLWDQPYRRSLNDRLAKTVVVRTAAPPRRG